MKRKLVTYIVLALSTCSLLAGCGKATESGETVDSGKETAIETVTNTENDATTVSSTGEAPAADAPGEVAVGEAPADGTDAPGEVANTPADKAGESSTITIYPGITFAITDDGSHICQIVNPDEIIDAVAAKMNSLSNPDNSAFPEGLEIRNDFVNYDAAQAISDDDLNACIMDEGLNVSKDSLKTVDDAQQLVPYLAYGKLTLSVIRQISDEYNIDLSNAEIHIDFLGGFQIVDATTGEAIMEFTDYASVNGYRYYIASWNENGSRKQVGYAVPDIML